MTDGTAKPTGIKFFTTVEEIKKHYTRSYHPGTWSEARGEGQLTYDLIDQGYFLHLKGSHEALSIGFDEPPIFAKGDSVSVTIKKEVRGD